MELASVHSMLPMSVADVDARLRAVIPPAAFQPRAVLAISAAGPWRPADLFPGAIERLAWTVRFDTPNGAIFTDEGAASLGRKGILRRQAPVHPGELYLRALGEGVFTLISDVAQLAYVAVYRDRQLRWSLLLEDRVRLVRCDGDTVRVQAPPEDVPEVDRTGVLLAGLYQWLREPLDVRGADRYVFGELLDAITPDPGVEVVLDGGWPDAAPLRVAAAR